MSMPFQHLEEACYRFISSGFKLENAVAWTMMEFEDDLRTINRAKYPEKPCANMINAEWQWRSEAA